VRVIIVRREECGSVGVRVRVKLVRLALNKFTLMHQVTMP